MDVTSRTYGDLAIKDGIWWLRTEPHVTIRVKRLFPKMSPNAQGILWVSDTLDTCRDLGWMLTRWPLRMRQADRDYLDSRVDKAVNLEASVREIQGGLRLGADDWMVPATVPRDYQLSAADLALATGRLIVVHERDRRNQMQLLQARTIPAPMPNTGGLLPCYIRASNWPDIYHDASHGMWKPPPVGISADDWPVLVKVHQKARNARAGFTVVAGGQEAGGDDTPPPALRLVID